MAEKKKKFVFKGSKETKTENAKIARKALKSLGVDKKQIDTVLKVKSEQEKKTSFSFKLSSPDAENFSSYASLLMQEKIANGKNLKSVQGEIASFAVLKLMKAEKYFQEILKGKK